MRITGKHIDVMYYNDIGLTFSDARLTINQTFGGISVRLTRDEVEQIIENAPSDWKE